MLATITGLTSLLGFAAAAPFSLPNGFPTPNAAALAQIEEAAGGTLPNTPLPTSLPADAIQTLQVVAFNEIWETAFFSSFLYNVTNDVAGFTDLPISKNYTMEILSAIVAQEELHAIGANAILASAGATTIPACDYMYGSTDFTSAIATADLFTELVLGVLQDVELEFATDDTAGTVALVQLFASIIGQEAQQSGGYRMLLGKVPSAAPFLTPGTGEFALNAVNQNFIVPGSCDAVYQTIGVPFLDTLALAPSSATPGDYNQTVTFMTSCTHTTAGADYLAYISGQNAAVVVPITDVQVNGNMATFSASLPFADGFAKGLTIAAVVNTNAVVTPADVTAAAIAGPGLIIVD